MPEGANPAMVGAPRDTPLPGWYDDPQSPERLRLWDGQRWTEQQRPSGDPAGRSDPLPAVRPGRPAWPWIVVAVIVLAAIVALAVARQSHGARDHPAAATKPRPVPALCTYPEPRPSASDVLGWFDFHGKLPAVADTHVQASIPTGGCSAAAFGDTRVRAATGYVVAMASADQASSLVQSIGGASFADYTYVVELDPRLQPFADEYRASLAAFMKILVPPTKPGVNISP